MHRIGSHLFQRVASFLPDTIMINPYYMIVEFSSLSESGFIPTHLVDLINIYLEPDVLISFREWLHSYLESMMLSFFIQCLCSHLFQRVASFLLR